MDEDYEDFQDAGDDTYPCQECGAPVWEDAEMCSECGTYVTDEAWGDHPHPKSIGTPVWIKFTAIVLIGIFMASAVIPFIDFFVPPDK